MIHKYILLITFFNEPKLILLHTVKLFQALQCVSNNSFIHQKFVYTQLNDHAVLFLTIQFSMSFVRAQFNVKHFYLIHR